MEALRNAIYNTGLRMCVVSRALVENIIAPVRHVKYVSPLWIKRFPFWTNKSLQLSDETLFSLSWARLVCLDRLPLVINDWLHLEQVELFSSVWARLCLDSVTCLGNAFSCASQEDDFSLMWIRLCKSRCLLSGLRHVMQMSYSSLTYLLLWRHLTSMKTDIYTKLFISYRKVYKNKYYIQKL